MTAAMTAAGQDPPYNAGASFIAPIQKQRFGVFHM
jgi:hypothetical protein